jgi:uncharacterized protein (TIGR00266 family)
MLVYELKNEKLIVSSSSFVGAAETLDMDLSWQGLKSVFSGESLFWIGVKGSGKVLLSSFGAIFEREVDGEYIIDTGHIVAFTETLNFGISKAGKSWLHSFLGGEGFVCRFKGRGKVWIQSHNPSAFGKTIGPMLRPR